MAETSWAADSSSVQSTIPSSSKHDSDVVVKSGKNGIDCDGNCKVCGEKSKSFHYGVLACEGCKSFFSRALTSHTSYSCPTNNCVITKETRNRCMYCRWLKCLAVGMSKDSSKLGRRPRIFKTKLAMESNKTESDSATPPKVLAVDVNAEYTMEYVSGVPCGLPPTNPHSALEATALPPDLSQLQITPPNEAGFGLPLPLDVTNSMVAMASQSNTFGIKDTKQQEATVGILLDEATLEEAARQTLSSYQRAFTFPCAHGFQSESILSFDSILRCHHLRFNQMITTASKNDDVSTAMFERMTGLIEKVVKFCKGVPGFKRLNLNDQMIILKGATFEIISLQTASVIDLTNELLTFLGDPHCVVPYEMLKGTPFGEMLYELKHVGGKIQSLDVNPTEMSLLCSVVLLSPGRPGLEQRDVVDKQQLLLSKALRHQLRQTHPANYEDVFASLMLLMPYIREINCQHSNIILNINKMQKNALPPLHKEVFESDD